MNLNDFLEIVNFFKSNKEFTETIIENAKKNSLYNQDFQNKIDVAIKDCQRGNNLSNETLDLIKSNEKEYLKIIESIKEKEKNNNMNNNYSEYDDFFWKLVNLNRNISIVRSWVGNTLITSVPIEQIKLPEGFYNINGKISNGKSDNDGRIEFNVTVKEIKKENKNNEEKKENTSIVKIDNNNTKKQEPNLNHNIDDINYYNFDAGHKYSSTYAQNKLNKAISNSENSINNTINNIYLTNSKVTKKDFYKLQDLETIKKDLEQNRVLSSDLTNSFGDKNRISRLDDKIDYYQSKINEKKEKMNKTRFVSIKKLIASKITKLQNKQLEIKTKQRKIIDESLIKSYNKALKNNHINNRSEALKKYYQYRQELIDAKRNESKFEIVNKIKDKIYNIRAIPLELQIKMISELQNIQIQYKERNGKSALYTQQMQKQNNRKAMGAA